MTIGGLTPQPQHTTLLQGDVVSAIIALKTQPGP